ncbi:MAG: SDR family oxidoreductase [Methylococcales bacterium]|jgi:3-hydroxy acid dehydrogenase / malonic semialdehyde reductase|nr:SDR family oxidoreductase [Methylococcales bacterium]MBT7409482.1 SDR family oxidoreductase [Methylococcales bacterium]
MKKTVLLTGSSSGIGKAICDLLLQNNFHVIGVCRHPDCFDHKHYTPIVCDLSKVAQIEQIFKPLLKNHLMIDVAILNAGVPIFGFIEQQSVKTIVNAIEMNLTSHLILSRLLLPILKRQQRSHLIFMGSESALQGGQQGSLYCAAKFGLRGFAQSLRQECAHSNVYISTIHPGMVKTSFFDNLYFEPGDQPENVVDVGDIAKTVLQIITSQTGSVFDEVVISPLKKVVKKK